MSELDAPGVDPGFDPLRQKATAYLIAVTVIACLPLLVQLAYASLLFLRSFTPTSGYADLDHLRVQNPDVVSLAKRLTEAKAAEAHVRSRVTFASLALAWAFLTLAWGPLIVSLSTDIPQGFIYSLWLPLPLSGFMTMIGPTLMLLAFRPLDVVGIRGAGTFLVLMQLYYVLVDTQQLISWHMAAAEAGGWETIPFILFLFQLAGCLFVALACAIGFFVATCNRSSRRALRRMWIVMQASFIIGACVWLPQIAIYTSIGEGIPPYLQQAAWWSFFGFVLGLPLTSSVRGLIHRWLGGIGMSDQMRGLAAVSSLIGRSNSRRPIHEVCEDAVKDFRFLSWSALRPEDLRSSGVDSSALKYLEAAAQPAQLGAVDAFISHSWQDDGFAKYEALEEWANDFRRVHEREPTIWLDKACIRQTEIERSLAGLPVFLYGCRSLVILYGHTYSQRLWCIMEIFCFVTMGGSPENIKVLALKDNGLSPELAAAGPADSRLRSARMSVTSSFRKDLRQFRLDDARCMLEDDRDRMLGVIESAFGDHVHFNTLVHELFTTHQRRTCNQMSDGHDPSSSPDSARKMISICEPVASDVVASDPLRRGHRLSRAWVSDAIYRGQGVQGMDTSDSLRSDDSIL